jgi:hypothetical protein
MTPAEIAVYIGCVIPVIGVIMAVKRRYIMKKLYSKKELK